MSTHVVYSSRTLRLVEVEGHRRAAINIVSLPLLFLSGMHINNFSQYRQGFVESHQFPLLHKRLFADCLSFLATAGSKLSCNNHGWLLERVYHA